MALRSFRRPLVALLLAVPALLAATPARAAGGLEGVPAYSHIAVVVLENESFSSTWGASSPATYLKSLVPLGAFADEYDATGHASLDNYIAMTSGQPDQPLTGTDCESGNLYSCSRLQSAMAGGRNIGDQLDDAQLSWKGYMDGMPSACFHADLSPSARPDPYQGNSTQPPAYNYADRHDPFDYYPDIVDNNDRCAAHVVPYTQLSTDIAGDAVPAFSFITPDTCHDGHDSPCAGGEPGGLVSADAWLRQNLPPLLSWLTANDGLLVITIDEGATSDVGGCCTGGPGGQRGFGGRVGLLALGAGIAAGTTTHTAYDHASLLRTVEDSFGITEHLNNAGSATPMADLFAPAADLPEAPIAGLLPMGAAVVVLALARRRQQRR